MKKILIALIMFLVTNIFAADSNLWQKSTLNKVLQRGELRIGTDAGYMPFIMKDKKGRYIGFEVDLAKRMAKEMGVKLKIVNIPFDGIIGGLLSDKFDMIISGMTITQTRNLKVNFSDPYLVIGQSILVTKETKKQIKTFKDLDRENFIIATKTGVTGELVARKLFKKAKIITFDTESDAVNEVSSGKANAFIYDQPYNVLYMAKKQNSQLVHLDKPVTYEPLGIAIKKGDPDMLNWLNAFIRQIQGDKLVGFYDKIYKKWFIETNWIKRVQ